jgi:hypothetical protein
MPALSNLILTDRASTPVDHTFTPEGIPNGVATVVMSDGSPVGDWRFTISTRKGAGRRRISLRLVVPVVATETINGVDNPKVVRRAYANVDFNFDTTSTTQERDDLVAMLMSAFDTSKTLVHKTVVDLEQVY